MSTKEKKTKACKKVYVQSRYKQAAENISHQTNRSREKSDVSQNSKDSQKSYCSQDSSSSRSSSRGMTSTPACKGELPLPAFDQSAVTNISTLPTLKGRIGYSPASSTKKNLVQKMKPVKPLQSYAPVIAVHKKGDQYDQNLADLEIDIQYSQYLQMVYLENEAKKVLKLRSDSSTEKLSKLYGLIYHYMHILKSKEFTLQLLSILMKVYNHLHKQENFLKPVYEVIPSLTEKYKNLADFVNESKHKLHIQDILLPDSSSEGDIADVLKQILTLITEFFYSAPNFKAVMTKVDNLETCIETGTDILTALKRGFDLLVEARDLYFTEASFLLNFESDPV